MSHVRSWNGRELVLAGLFLLAILGIVASTEGCSPPLSDADKAHVAGDGIQISMCAAEAHLCKRFEQTSAPDASLSKCWDDYDTCLSTRGFRDAGPRPARTLNFANDNDGGAK